MINVDMDKMKAVKLAHLLGVVGDFDVSISGVTTDSRNVKSGDLFVAIPGSRFDGRDFIQQAVKQGAVAVLSTPDAAAFAEGAVFIEDMDPRRRYGEIAARLAGQQVTTQVAVTGTNGKTSVADFTRQIWEYAGLSSASYGTLGLRGNGISRPGGLTTPDPVALFGALADAANVGVTHLAIEASSHGLDQRRIDPMQIDAAAFTNLTRDHLDYHGTFEAYFAAKARLLTEILPRDKTAVIHVGDAAGQRMAELAKGLGQSLITVADDSDGQKADLAADLRIISRKRHLSGQDLTVEYHGKQFGMTLPLIGDFQADNALVALGLAVATGVDETVAFKALGVLSGVPGRMEYQGKTEAGGAVYIDYAHTPSGLETVLSSARMHSDAALSVVFGCGGDRDKGKRPQMGEIAHRLADQAYVTDDNPRSEDAAVIRSEIMAQAPNALEFGDRGDAIKAAIKALKAGDILIIAGKGHEEGQIVGDQILPFSDTETVQKLLAEGVRQ